VTTLREKIKELLRPYSNLPKEVYVIFVARIINAMGVLVFPLLTLILVKKIGLSIAEAGFWISITGILFGPASLIGGKLADTIGRKIIIIIFDILGAATYLVIALIEPSFSMIYLIMLAVFFMGIAQPAHDALMADLTTPENRSGAYSLSYMGFNIGFIIGPVIGGFLFEEYLPLVFLIDGITALLAVLLVFFFIKETFSKTKEDLGEDRELEKRVEGSIFKVLAGRRILLYFALISLGYSFIYSQWTFLIPIHAEQNFVNEGAKLYGQLSGFNGFIVMVFTPIITMLFARKKNIRRIVYGGVLYTVAFGILGFISTKAIFFFSIFIFTLGEIFVTISSMPFIANHTPASHRGRMSSIIPMLIGFGHVIGPVVMGGFLTFMSIPTAWKLIGAIILTFAGLMLLLEKLEEKNIL